MSMHANFKCEIANEVLNNFPSTKDHEKYKLAFKRLILEHTTLRWDNKINSKCKSSLVDCLDWVLCG